MDVNAKKILNEITRCIETTDFSNHNQFVNYIAAHDKILLTGAGRVGLVMRSFAMRLMHPGFSAHYLGEVTVPHFQKGDLLLIGSGSGATPSILATAQIAFSKELHIALVTSSNESPIGKLSNLQLLLSAPSKNEGLTYPKSIQPMTTLFEQTLQIYLDSVVLDLMEVMKVTSSEMWDRHNAIE